MEPNPILISNQHIFESVQPETLDEPVSKSTILYANKFAGIQETDIKDEALLEILNSTIGTSGNNVLVQLKQKMQAYPGGPWYIDSNDGVVHIHNRKFTEKTSHVYTYMAEPGEVLSASFKIVEVYKQNTAGLAAYVNAVNKTVSALLNPSVDNPPERPYTVSPEERRAAVDRAARAKLVCLPDKTRVNNTNIRLRAEMDEFNRRRQAAESARQKQAKEWSSKTPQQRQAVRNQYCNQAWDRAVNDGLEDIVRQAPEYRELIIRWDYYRDMCESYGSNSPQAKKAFREYKDMGADRAYISGINTQQYWDWHEFLLSVTNSFQSGSNVAGGIDSRIAEQSRPAAIQKAIDTWKRHHVGRFSGGIQVVQQGAWTTVKKKRFRYNTAEERGDEYYQITEKCKIRIKVYSMASKPYKYPLSRLLGEYTCSGGTQMGEHLAAMKNAAANIGRAKKEKQLQANIRVVGNPELESTQQFIIQNVGKKYSGVWYIKSVSHTFEHGQGYICDLVLSKQQGKSKVSGESGTVNTRNYTSGSGKGSTSKNGRPLANRVPSDNYTYQDAMNEQWTAEETLYVKHAVFAQGTEAGARQALEAQAYNIADKNMYNHQNNSSSSYVTMGKGTITGRYKNAYSSVKRQRVQLPKQALDVLREYRNHKGK